MAFECVSKTDVGLRRKVNEDSLLVRTERGLWAVADGMGGHDAGDVASSKVTESLLELPDANDLVVDTASMDALSDMIKIEGPKAVLDFGTSAVVHHLNYFAQPEVATFIRQSLALK